MCIPIRFPLCFCPRSQCWSRASVEVPFRVPVPRRARGLCSFQQQQHLKSLTYKKEPEPTAGSAHRTEATPPRSSPPCGCADSILLLLLSEVTERPFACTSYASYCMYMRDICVAACHALHAHTHRPAGSSQHTFTYRSAARSHPVQLSARHDPFHAG